MTELPPDGLTTRPLTKADSRILFELIAAQERADTGSTDIEEADLVSDWAKPSYDLVGVLGRGLRRRRPGGVRRADRRRSRRRRRAPEPPRSRDRHLACRLAALVGYGAWLDRRRDAGAAGVGRRPAARPRSATGSAGPAGSCSCRRAPGSRRRDLPDGYRVREATRPTTGPRTTCSRTRSSSGRCASASPTRTSRPARSGARATSRGTSASRSMRTARWSGCLSSSSRPRARRPTSRGSPYARTSATAGLAQALLVDSFAAGREHGATISELSTDSRTGALGLYEKVGMVVQSVWVNRAIDLLVEQHAASVSTGLIHGGALLNQRLGRAVRGDERGRPARPGCRSPSIAASYAAAASSLRPSRRSRSARVACQAW